MLSLLVAIGVASAGVEIEDMSDGMSTEDPVTEDPCTKAQVVVFPTRWEIDFSATATTSDVESLTLFGFGPTGTSFDVQMVIENIPLDGVVFDGGTSPFTFHDVQGECVTSAPGGASCGIVLGDGASLWDTVRIVYTPGDRPADSETNAAMMHVSWVDPSTGTECPIGDILLDGTIITSSGG